MAKHTPRLSVDISRDQQIRMQNLIPYGMKKAVITRILEDVLTMVERDGPLTLYRITVGEIRLERKAK